MSQDITVVYNDNDQQCIVPVNLEETLYVYKQTLQLN